jgi:hypothetical protein
MELTLEIPDRKRVPRTRFRVPKTEKWAKRGAVSEKFRRPTNRNQGTLGGLGGLSTSQKTLKNYWGALAFISRPWKKSKFGSQMNIFLPLGAMFGAPEHGPKNSKMSF